MSPQDSASLRQRQIDAWHLGAKIALEELLADAGEYDEALLLDLIYSEVLLREAAGEWPNAAEYCRRFPKHTDRINRILELHAELVAGAAIEDATNDELNSLSLIRSEVSHSLVHRCQQEIQQQPSEQQSAVLDKFAQRFPALEPELKSLLQVNAAAVEQTVDLPAANNEPADGRSDSAPAPFRQPVPLRVRTKQP